MWTINNIPKWDNTSNNYIIYKPEYVYLIRVDDYPCDFQQAVELSGVSLGFIIIPKLTIFVLLNRVIWNTQVSISLIAHYFDDEDTADKSAALAHQ